MPTRIEAFRFLQDEGPKVFGTDVGSLLYVGHRHDTHPWWWQGFCPAIGATEIAVIDIVEGNARTAEGITKQIYVGDVRNPALVPADFGLVFWDEGPEHMARDEALQLIVDMRTRHRGVLISCPWGYQPQGSGPSDPEFHHWGPQPEDFQSIGMETRTFGEMFHDGGLGYGNLIAWLL